MLCSKWVVAPCTAKLLKPVIKKRKIHIVESKHVQVTVRIKKASLLQLITMIVTRCNTTTEGVTP